eukprot:1188071-Prorocentrum_minimum.AAC.1
MEATKAQVVSTAEAAKAQVVSTAEAAKNQAEGRMEATKAQVVSTAEAAKAQAEGRMEAAKERAGAVCEAYQREREGEPAFGSQGADASAEPPSPSSSDSDSPSDGARDAGAVSPEPPKTKKKPPHRKLVLQGMLRRSTEMRLAHSMMSNKYSGLGTRLGFALLLLSTITGLILFGAGSGHEEGDEAASLATSLTTPPPPPQEVSYPSGLEDGEVDLEESLDLSFLMGAPTNYNTSLLFITMGEYDPRAPGRQPGSDGLGAEMPTLRP